MSSLSGKSVLVTRAPGYAGGLRDALIAQGAHVDELPMIGYEPPDDQQVATESLRRARDFDFIIFTSAMAIDGVRRIADRIGASEWVRSHARFVAVGEATARAVRDAGVETVAVSERTGVEGVISLLADEVLLDKRVLLPRAQEGRDELREWLVAQGANVTVAPVYRTAIAAEVGRLQELLNRGIDVVTFTSPSTVAGFMATAGDGFQRPGGLLVACIGPTTALAASEAGLRPDIVPAEATAEALAAAIGDYFASHVLS